MRVFQAIGVTGAKHSGKGVVGEILTEVAGYVKVDFADPLRTMAVNIDPIVGYALRDFGDRAPLEVMAIRYTEAIKRYGYEQAKVEFPELRRFLQRLGTDGVRKVLDDSMWLHKWIDSTRELTRVVATDVRFLNEGDCVRHAWSGLSGQANFLIRVDRPGYEPGPNAHVSETELFKIPVQAVIVNDGTLADLRAKVLAVVPPEFLTR